MAPERPAATLSRAHTPKEIPHNREVTDFSKSACEFRPFRNYNIDQFLYQAEWPLPARVVRQIQRQVARAGRSLQRLEVQGTVIDNFDALGPLSPPSPHHQLPVTLIKAEPDFYEEDNVEVNNGNNGADEGLAEDNDLTNLTWLQDSNLLRSDYI